MNGPARRFARDRLAVAGLVVMSAIVVLGFFAPWLAPHDPDRVDVTLRFLPLGSHGYYLGTDELGRDQLSRLLYGARVSMAAAAIAVAVAACGAPLGVIAGYYGGRVDAILNWINDALMSVPALLLALTIITVLGRGLVSSMMAVGIVLSPRFFRLARATARQLSREVFVEALVSVGVRPSRILLRHVVPNMLSPLLVQVATTWGVSLIAEATLSFLGAGIPPPAASWGSMIGYAYGQIYAAPFLIYAPGLAVMVSVLALVLVGDGLRRAIGRDAGDV